MNQTVSAVWNRHHDELTAMMAQHRRLEQELKESHAREFETIYANCRHEDDGGFLVGRCRHCGLTEGYGELI